MLHPTFNLFFVTFCQKTKENIADFKKKAMGFLADRCTFVRYLAVDALNNPRTLNYYEKNGFAYLFEDEEQLPLYIERLQILPKLRKVECKTKKLVSFFAKTE